MKYFMDNSPTPEAAIRAEIRRYFVWPGQATAYKIGMIKIQELRAMAQKELGDKFTMGGFHDTVLGGGADAVAGSGKSRACVDRDNQGVLREEIVRADTMRNWISAGLLAVVAACTPAAPPAPTAEEISKASAELTAWFDAEYEEELQLSPISLTFIGRKDQYDKLDTFGDAQIDRDLAWRRASVAEMKEKFDPAKLDEESRTSFEMWEDALAMEEKGAAFRRSPYVFVKDGPHVFLPNFLINFHSVSEKSDMEAYVARLGALATAMDQAVEVAKLAAAEGNHAPRFAYEQSIQEVKNVTTGAPFGPGADSPLFADAKAKIKGLLDGGKITADEAKTLAGRRRQGADRGREAGV